MKPTPIIVLGAGQHGKIVCSTLIDSTHMKFSLECFADDNLELLNKKILGIPVLGRMCDLRQIIEAKKIAAGIVGVSCAHMHLRRKLFEEIVSCGLIAANAVSPEAHINPRAQIGSGCVITPGAVVHAFAKIGDNCVLYSNSVVEHECRIGNNVFIGPGVSFSADVMIGDDTFIGVGASIIGPKIGSNVIIGAGSVVIRDVPDHAILAGNPARILKIRTEKEINKSYRLRIDK